jgi:hypothetical protein
MEIGYNLEKLEADIQRMQPRAFDTWVLPGFIMLYAYKSRKGMSVKVRRVLFIAGVYMAYHNYARYKQAMTTALNYIKNAQGTEVAVTSEQTETV